MTEIDTSNMSPEEIAELQKQNCIFCKIAEKQIPARILHEDDKVICILDINPASEGHILVYPKDHYMILPHIPDDLLAHLFNVARLMSNTLLKVLQSGGTSIFIANGMAAGQKAPHILIHVFPRRMDDGLLKLPNYTMNDDQKSKLKAVLKNYFIKEFGPTKNAKEKEHITKTEDASDKKIEEKPKKDIEEKKEKKTKEKPKKDTEEKKTKESKIDLDDISRLFS